MKSKFFSEILPIVRSEAKSWYKDDKSPSTFGHSPDKAYDGDYLTTYNVKDGDTEGNFLKLYLSKEQKIGTVKLTNVKKGCCEHRIIGTVVMVYSNENRKESKVADCGEKITSKKVTRTLVSL